MISRQKDLFPLSQESVRTTFHHPEGPYGRTYGRTYGDIITKFSRMDSLPNFLTHGAPLRARPARESSANNNNDFILVSMYLA